VAILAACLVLAGPAIVPAEQVAVRYSEGVVHGFLSLRTLGGTLLATGDITQVPRGDQVTARLVFHFKDGSLHDETTVFTQRGQFRLISDRVVQKGPAFPRQLDMTVNMGTGRVTVRYTDAGKKEEVEEEKLDLPPDVANGIMPVLLKNVRAGSLPAVSYVAATPKPRIVKVILSSAGVDTISISGSSRRAIHYVAKVEIGGLTGALASIFGKEPPDNHLWILDDAAPAFLKSEGPLYVGGPSWRIELTSLVSPAAR
jgi:hypothetical protein